MHPADCPEFEYSYHPDAADVLPHRHQELLEKIRAGEIDASQASANTRPYHLFLFQELCPPGCIYFAGHYRGEPFRCLRYYGVQIRSDPMVGSPPNLVSGQIAELALSIRADLAGFDEAFRAPRTQLPAAQKILYVVAFACRVFVKFLTIHPYANGNGHMARFCMIAILARYGLALTAWKIDPSPAPPYADLIAQHRRGVPGPLEAVVLRQCAPIHTL